MISISEYESVVFHIIGTSSKYITPQNFAAVDLIECDGFALFPSKWGANFKSNISEYFDSIKAFPFQLSGNHSVQE